MPEAGREGAGRHILVVDDEPATLKVLETALRRRGYEVSTATSAARGLELMDRSHFDVVIADIIMPEMDGFAFLAEVRKRPDTAAVPFIFLTGDRSLRSKVKGLELGVDEYITKPCAIDELYARLGAILRRTEAAAVRAAPTGAAGGDWDLSGRLSAMPAHELMQSLQVNQKSGVLRVTTGFGQGEIYFDGGAVVHASFEGIDGAEAVYLLFALDEGQFDFRGGVKATKRTVEASTPSLLLEGMRRMDETRSLLAARDAATRRVSGADDAGNR
jgi:DNA-binding response OmpR family regulator